MKKNSRNMRVIKYCNEIRSQYNTSFVIMYYAGTCIHSVTAT
jgi:hypothetical protein